MDESEIDSWYEDQKEVLGKKMQKQLMAGKTYEDARKDFDSAFKKLIDEMRAKHLKLADENAAKEKDLIITKRVEEKVKNFQEEITLWLEKRKMPQSEEKE